MNNTKPTTKFISFLSGFHLHKPDYNYEQVKGRLFNTLSEILEMDFDIISIRKMNILKNKSNNVFAIHFNESSLTYENDTQEYNEFKDISFKVLKAWQELNPSASNLRLAGLRKRFEIEISGNMENQKSKIYQNYLKNFNINDRQKLIKLHLNYLKSVSEVDYNINLTIEERFEPKQTLEVIFDVNRISEKQSIKIGIEEVNDIFEYANNFFLEEYKKEFITQITE